MAGDVETAAVAGPGIRPGRAFTPDRSHLRPVTTREELIYLLSRACELEHGLACLYLFAAHSLKSDVREGGMTGDQVVMVRRWRAHLARVAVEEMLHLAQASNMLTAVGGAPNFRRTNFPLPPTAFPFGLSLTLEPFSTLTIERFVTYELPEPGVLSPEDQATCDAVRARVIAAQGEHAAGRLDTERVEDLEPFEIDFTTVGELYHKIETAFWSIDQQELFIGPPEAQANGRFLDFGGELVSVVDRASACAGIDMIIEQGEAPTAAHPDAHYAIFEGIRRELAAELAAAAASGVPFEPVRPVTPNPMTRYYDDTSGGTIIAEETTHDAADLFNVAYDTMLQMLLRFFSHTDESDDELEFLSRSTLRLMTSVLRPLGDALAKMPIDPSGLPGRTAGPGFGYNRDIHLLSHQRSAWMFFAERLWELATSATTLWQRPGVPTEVQEAAATLQDLACIFAERLGLSGAKASEAKAAGFRALQADLPVSIKASFNGPYLVTNAQRVENWLGEPIPTRPQLALCRCGGSRIKPLCDGTHARIGFTGAKEPDRVADHRESYEGNAITVFDNRGICAHSGLCTDSLAKAFRLRQEPFVDPDGAPVEAIIRAVRACPSGALGYAIAPPEGPSGPAARVRGPDPARPGTILVSRNGPYRVTGGIPVTDPDGRPEAGDPGTTREHYSLCRCGQSKNKPFCSGAHWSVASFRDPPMAAEPSLFAWAGGVPAMRQLTSVFYDDLVDADPMLGPLFAGRAPAQAGRMASWLGEVMGGPEAVPVPGGLPAGGPGALIPEAVGTLTEPQRARWLALLEQAADLAGLPGEPEFRAAFIGYLDGASRAAPGAGWARWRRWDWTPAGRPPAAAPDAAAVVQPTGKLPGPEQPVHFDPDIKALFRPTDREHMEFAFDLWSYQDVAKHCQLILDRLLEGSMPCDGAWSAEQIAVYQRWVDAGLPE